VFSKTLEGARSFSALLRERRVRKTYLALLEGRLDRDAAIKEASVKMGKNLPPKTEVALVSLASTSSLLSEYVISRLEAALVEDGKLIVLDRANLDKVRKSRVFSFRGMWMTIRPRP
jgi:23S rRNA-/tRNA-specific pseudouridylate synthase